ncbi:uncharacterized protein PGTG_07228 [Puccinia graminis f. sp. tritici CRL 75-36-700-3]|uniref:Uncharacterized protein n=1 Tax=Puccinia graminis f. sp. tritici (strain CRL 75-36-700-3 / race SCCL) TaxID=418459 RepID=E3K9Y1_PUCGT|nr:uncharacterized protein PGTG_07228 [Puccinia graminis f. sp. tritici CRL 75-36-700-3]EFP80976.2 hypothetical protein PGTG_07228 [Puccinia graminis f. sp. tritici CRL 75-36-700-3]
MAEYLAQVGTMPAEFMVFAEASTDLRDVLLLDNEATSKPNTQMLSDTRYFQASRSMVF